MGSPRTHAQGSQAVGSELSPKVLRMPLQERTTGDTQTKSDPRSSECEGRDRIATLGVRYCCWLDSTIFIKL